MLAEAIDPSNVIEPTRPGRAVRYAAHTGRILLGLAFFAFGVSGLFNLMPEPSTPLPERAAAFVTALVNSGYMMQLIMATQLVVGALLLANRFVPLALVLIAPFLVNSLAFHVFLERSGLIPSLIFCAITVGLMWVYRAAYRPLFTARATPGAR